MAKKKDSVVMQEKNLQQVSAQQRVMQILVKTITYLFLGVMALIVLFPFYWMIISSLKDLAEYRENIPTLWPRKMIFYNYVEAINSDNPNLSYQFVYDFSPMLEEQLILGGYRLAHVLNTIFG